MIIMKEHYSMARREYSDESKPCANSPSTSTAARDADPFRSTHKKHTQGAFITHFPISNSRDRNSGTLSSNIAQRDEDEPYQNINDGSAYVKIDSQSKGVEHRRMLLPDNEK